jgi:small subunit ribosomal protein S3
MGHKTSPIGNRLGIIRGWDSNWFGGKRFETKLVEDDKIRKYVNARLIKAGIAKVNIERTLKLVTVTIHAARPGMIIGKAGSEVDKLKEELKKITQKEIQINISEVKRPELDALLTAASVARQLEGRVSYRKAIKTAISSTMRMGAEGIKIQISGRLGGAEMARTEHFKEGRTPLHTLRADIDYALAEAHTTYGRLGIKVWICKGIVYGKRDIVPAFSGMSTDNKSAGGERGGDRRGGDRRPSGGGDRRSSGGGDRRPSGGGDRRGGGERRRTTSDKK